MFKKINLKTLLILFAFLLLAVITVSVMDGKKGKRSFRKEIVSFSPEEVTTIDISEAGGNKELTLLKENEIWKITKEDGHYPADNEVIENVLKTLVELKPQRVASTSKEKWKKYELTDSVATKVTIKKGSKGLATLFIGKFSFKQNKQAQQNPYMKQQPQISSFVRVDDDKNVYAVEGFLKMNITADANRYRNKTIVKLNPENITKLKFTYPADSSFTLLKQNNVWMVDGLVADSAKTATYMEKLRNVSQHSFVEAKDSQFANPAFSLHIEGNNFKAIDIKVIDGETKKLQTSENIGNFFNVSEGELFKRLMPSKTEFLK